MEIYRTASADNTLLDLLNSSYPTHQPHSLIAKYLQPQSQFKYV